MGTSNRYYEKGWNDFIWSSGPYKFDENTFIDKRDAQSIVMSHLKSWHKQGWEAAEKQAQIEGWPFYLKASLEYVRASEGAVNKNILLFILAKIQNIIQAESEKFLTLAETRGIHEDIASNFIQEIQRQIEFQSVDMVNYIQSYAVENSINKEKMILILKKMEEAIPEKKENEDDGKEIIDENN